MPYFFIMNGNYFETLTDVTTPEGAIELPKRPSPTHDWIDGEWVENPLRATEHLVEMKANWQRYVDRKIDGYRKAFITEIAGQQTIYSLKQAELAAFRADTDDPIDPTKYGYMAAEAADAVDAEVAAFDAALAAMP